jgi:hypothetical protein
MAAGSGGAHRVANDVHEDGRSTFFCSHSIGLELFACDPQQHMAVG